MLKKRTSAKSCNDDQTSQGSSLFQEDDNAKRAKLVSLYDTTLQDLPVELLECILVKAVVMEVKSMKLAKTVWKEKADLVISRLKTVCSQWCSVLSTNFFRKQIHRTLDGQETIRLEILHQPSFRLKVFKLTTMKDEIFLLCSPLYRDDVVVINVYDRNNMANMKDVIQLPRMWPGDMAACSVSNCVYIVNRDMYCPSIFRIAKVQEHHFKTSPWINDLQLPVYDRGPISVSADGSLIVLTRPQSPHEPYRRFVRPKGHIQCNEAYVGIYNAHGSMQHKIRLSPDIHEFRHVNSLIQKSNGNIVLVANNGEGNAKLLEIDTIGGIVRQYQSPLARSVMDFADIHGRILINDFRNRIELLDSEFNLLEIEGPRLLEGSFYDPPPIHFNSERNELVRIEKLMHKFDGATRDWKFQATVLSIFRFKEG